MRRHCHFILELHTVVGSITHLSTGQNKPNEQQNQCLSSVKYAIQEQMSNFLDIMLR